MTGPWFIYALVDPRDHSTRYIGRATDLAARLRGHEREKDCASKHKWVLELRTLGLRPEIRELERCDYHEAVRAERQWIIHGYRRGWALFNQAGLGREKPCATGNCQHPVVRRGLCLLHWRDLAEREGMYNLFNRRVFEEAGVKWLPMDPKRRKASA